MTQVNVNKAQAHLSALIARVRGGEDVVITEENGQPLVRLTAVGGKKRQPGSAKGLIQIGDDFDEPLEDFQAYQ